MAESIVARVRRVIAASLEDVVDAMERAGGTGVMRETIREVDRVIEEVRTEHDGATTRRLQATRQARLFRERLAALDEKARFALAEKREDLAEAAIARQLDFEAQAEALEQAATETAADLARLDECLAALRHRKAQMEEALATFELARRDAAPAAEDRTVGAARRSERRVERAEAAFGRAMMAAGGTATTMHADAEAAAKVAEIDAMQRSAVIAQRLASLRASPGG